MQFERFIAQRFMPRRGADSGFSGPLSTIAVVGIALGVIVMIMAVSILRGFQQNITDKVVGFGSHLIITPYDAGGTYTEVPLTVDSTLVTSLHAIDGVRHVQTFATKGGMVKTDNQIYGIMLRGVSDDYDTVFYHNCLVGGHLPQNDNEVLVSSTIASKLSLKPGDKMRTYFWGGDSPRSRAFIVGGIYNTDLTEMDELYVIGSLHTVQRLNDWDSCQVGGYELLANDYRNLDNVAQIVSMQLPYDLRLTTITQAHPALFSWLDLLNTNITLILAIMCLVSAVAIVSALLIMIYEKSSTIGLLKALGSSNQSIRRIFLLKATNLMLRGIIIGDVIALAMSLAQQHWQIIRLDPESYSMSHVPVDIDPWVYFAVSVGTLIICLLALLLPTAGISRISPAESMRKEK